MNHSDSTTIERRRLASPVGESNRLLLRTELKRQRDAANLAEIRWRELVAMIAERNARKEEIANEHAVAVGPIQTELASIEQEQISRIAAKQSIDPASEKRRRELLGELQSRTADLETAIAAEDRAIAELEPERINFARGAAAGLIEGDLFSTSHIDLRVASKVATRMSERAQNFLDSVSEQYDLAPSKLLKALCDEARTELARWQEKMAERYKACIDE